jgi:hypothetical protein
MTVETQITECLRVKVYLVVEAGASAPAVVTQITEGATTLAEGIVEFHMPVGTLAVPSKGDVNAP